MAGMVYTSRKLLSISRLYLTRIPRLQAPGTTVKAHSINAFPQLRVSIRACGRRTFGLIRRQIAHGVMCPFFEPEVASEHGARNVAPESLTRSLRV
jgi:hypothetical protein